MTDIEKLKARITATDLAIIAVHAATVADRKLSQDHHASGHFTKAISELTSVRENLDNQLTRINIISQ
jgi:hypothetical protein